MKWFRKIFGSFTLTILSDDINKEVNTVRIPRIVVPILIILAIIPIILLFYYMHIYIEQEKVSIEQLHVTKQLEENLANEVKKASTLEGQVSNLEEKTIEVQEKLTKLNILEEELREQLEELPVELTGSGGIDIQDFEEQISSTNESVDSLVQLDDIQVQSNYLIDRYETSILNMKETTKQMAYIPTEWPADSTYITSEYGVRSDPFSKRSSFHSGIDIRGYWGDPVYASANGTVKYASYKAGYGNMITIRHSNKYETAYAHLSKMLVSKHEEVEKGDLIGYIGSTGRSTGPHLHFELLEYGEYINPYEYLEAFQ